MIGVVIQMQDFKLIHLLVKLRVRYSIQFLAATLALPLFSSKNTT